MLKTQVLFKQLGSKDAIEFLKAEPRNIQVKEYDYEDILGQLQDGWLQNFNSNVRLVNKWGFPSFTAMQHALENLPDLQEGFVAQDANGLRVKFKNSLYLKLHKMRGDLGFTEKKIAAIVAEGEEDEVLTYFGQYKHLFDPIIYARNRLFRCVEASFNGYNTIEDQKAFALKVKGLLYSALLFTMRNHKKTFQEAWNDAREEYKIELILKYKE